MGFCDMCNLYPPEQEIQYQEVNFKTEDIQQSEIQIDGGLYQGEVLENEPSGFGKFQTQTGGFHEGYWKNGVPHGFGKVTYENGDTYEGVFVSGKRSGQGKYKSSNYEYIGDWVDGKMSGFGVMSWQDG